MRLPTRPIARRPHTRILRGPGLIRIRLWFAMLGLAVLQGGRLVTLDSGIPLNAVPSATAENLVVI